MITQEASSFMQELHVDSVPNGGTVHRVSRRTATLVVVLFGAVILGALTLLTTPAGQRISGLKLESLASLASKSDQSEDPGTASAVNCITTPCPGGTLVVVSPTGGQFLTGDSMKIKWSYADGQLEKDDSVRPAFVSTVQISLQRIYPCPTVPAELCATPDIAPYLIAESEADDGEYDWTIPTSLAEAFLGEVRIIIATSAGQRAESQLLTISRKSQHTQTLIITSPSQTDSWQVGTTHAITWQNGVSGTQNSILKLLVWGKVDFTPHVIAQRFAGNSYNWVVPGNLAPEFYINPVQVQLTLRGETAISQPFWIVANSGGLPQISTTSMTNGTATYPYSFQFDVAGGMAPYQWSVTAQPGTGSVQISQGGMFTASSPKVGNWRINVTVKDSSGQQSSREFLWTVTGQPLSQPHPVGSLVLGLDNIPSGVSLVIDGGRRMVFPTGGVFMSHGYKWENIVPANSGDQGLFIAGVMEYASGTLVIEHGDRTVYLLYPNKVKRGFSSTSAFNNMGYTFDMVYYAPRNFLSSYTVGTPISSIEPHPNGTDIIDGRTIYRIDDNARRRAYPSIKVYDSWHTDLSFRYVVRANQFDRALPEIAPMNERY